MDQDNSGLSSNTTFTKRKWRVWHERESLVKVTSNISKKGIDVNISSKLISKSLSLRYPNKIWEKYPAQNKTKLLDNIAYVFTAHLPYLLKGNIGLQYNTGYPQVYSWANHCFTRHLPSYWYLQGAKRGMGINPLLKTMINSSADFARTKDRPPRFPESIDENVIIPFTFGKDSFLTYHICKSMGFNPTLIFFEDPMDNGYEGLHKKKLFASFKKVVKDISYYIENPLGNLREKESGWFGWELAITSWAILSLPFAYIKKAGYIIFSNEKSVNTFFYDKNGYKIATEFEQSDQGVEEMSLLTQALSEGEVYTTTFLQGLHDLGIISILKNNYYEKTFPFLMSCWSENEKGKHKRWCGACSKCARIYAYLLANGIDPIKEAGYEDNMLTMDKISYFSIFGKAESASGWDLFAVNQDEMALAFYLIWLRGGKDPLVKEFAKTDIFTYAKERYENLIEEYFGLHQEKTTPPQWKKKIDSIFNRSLKKTRRELYLLKG